VVLDVCAGHGVWFDRDELEAVLAWVGRGGATPAEAPAVRPARPAGPGGAGGWLGEGERGGWAGGGWPLADLLAEVVLAIGGLFRSRR
jgi:hypothetical protein